MNGWSIRSLAMVLGIAWLALPSVVSAKPNNVVLAPIDGDASGQIGEAIADAIDGGVLAVVPQKAVTRALDKLGYDGELTEKQAKKLGSELGADTVIQASLNKEGSSKVLRVKLFVNGKKGKSFTVTFGNAKSQRFKSMLRDKIVSRLGLKDDGDTGTTDDEDPVAEPKGAKGKKAEQARKAAEKAEAEKAERAAAKAEKAEKAAAKSEKAAEKAEKAAEKAAQDKAAEKEEKAAAKEDKEEESEQAEPAETDDEEQEPAPPRKKKVARVDDEDAPDEEPELEIRARSKRAANRVAARVDVGVSVANRTLTYNSRLNFPEAPQAFRSAPVPAARFEAEMYPLAFTNPNSVAAGLGLAVEYDRTLALKLNTETEPGVNIKTTQQHYSVGARFRYVFGTKNTSPSITLGVGYGRRTFLPDRTGLMVAASLDLPDTDYKMIDPGLSIRVPLAPIIAFTLAGKAMLITDAGPIQKADSYGQATVTGGTAQVGVDIVLGNRFAIRIVGEFAQIGFKFAGTGAESNARDNDPATPDVGGARDRSFGGAATLAVLY